MTRATMVSLLARIFCGAVFVVHGTPKIFNLQGTAIFFADNFGVPGWLAVPIALLEFFGGILLMSGFLTRIARASRLLASEYSGIRPPGSATASR